MMNNKSHISNPKKMAA